MFCIFRCTGARLPHVGVKVSGKQMSLLDLTGHKWLVIVPQAAIDDVWLAAADAVSKETDFKLNILHLVWWVYQIARPNQLLLESCWHDYFHELHI